MDNNNIVCFVHWVDQFNLPNHLGLCPVQEKLVFPHKHFSVGEILR